MSLHIRHGWLAARPNMGWNVGGFDIDPATKTRNVEYDWVLSEVRAKAADSSLRILDCAAGYVPTWHLMADILAADGHQVVAVDQDERSLDMPPNPRIERRLEDIADLSNIATNSFDISICVSALEHIAFPNRLLTYQEMLRVTKKSVIITADHGFFLPCELLFLAHSNADLERCPFFGQQMEPPVYFCVIDKCS